MTTISGRMFHGEELLALGCGATLLQELVAMTEMILSYSATTRQHSDVGESPTAVLYA